MRLSPLLAALTLAAACSQAPDTADAPDDRDETITARCEVDDVVILSDSSVPADGFVRSADDVVELVKGEFLGTVDLAGRGERDGWFEALGGREARAVYYVWVDGGPQSGEPSPACPPQYEIDFRGQLSAGGEIDELFTSVLRAPSGNDPVFSISIPIDQLRGSIQPAGFDTTLEPDLVIQGRFGTRGWEGNLEWQARPEGPLQVETAGWFTFDLE